MAFLDETGLQYYDTKIKEYITQKVSDAVGNITSFRFEVVTELPQTGEVGVVYLKALAEQESSNLYEEFIWVDDSYEFIGTNEVNLSGYYTKEETNKLVEDSAYTLPTASDTELGGIKVGENLTITDGVLSATNNTYEAADFDINELSDASNLKDSWNNKQDAISDLEAIREGAALGKTSVQSLDGYYTSGEVDSLVEGKQAKFTLGSNLELSEGVLSAVDTTYSNATETEAGLMSAEDKVKLNSLSNYELPADIQVSSISLTTSEGTTVSLTGDVLAQLLALIAVE